MKIAQVHPNLVAREDALEYVEVGKNINLSINMNMNIYIVYYLWNMWRWVSIDGDISSELYGD